MVAFLALHYAFYVMALIVFGILLRTGVLAGEDSVELTIVPAAVAGLAPGRLPADRADSARPGQRPAVASRASNWASRSP